MGHVRSDRRTVSFVNGDYTQMSATVKPERSPEEAVAVTSAVEGEIREFVRRDLIATRKARSEPAAADIGADNITSLIQRVAGASVSEIDHLISELQHVRDFLQAEADRVQREVANYTHVSQTALASVKIITDSMGQWKSAAPVRGE